MGRLTFCRIARLALVFVWATLGLFAGEAPSKKAIEKALPQPRWNDVEKTATDGTQFCTFESKVIGQTVSYLLYLPPDYEAQPERRYPVVYWLHGLGGSQRTGADFFVPHLDAAIREKVAPPMIAVMVNGMVSSFYNDAPDGKMPVESVIIKDLVPHIDRTYRTIARREGRAVQGYSMGGWGAAHLGFKYPDLFGVVCIDAGALLQADAIRTHREGIIERMFGNDMENFTANHPATLIRKNADAVRGRTFIRIGCGNKDNLLKANEDYHRLLDSLNIEHEFEAVPGIGHAARDYYKALGSKGFAFYAKAFGRLAP